MSVQTQIDFTHILCQCLQGHDDTSALAQLLYNCNMYNDRYYVFGNDDSDVYDYMTEKLNCFVRNESGGFILTRDARRIVQNAIETMRDYRVSDRDIERRINAMEVNPLDYNGHILYAEFHIDNPKQMIFRCTVKNAFIPLRMIPDYLGVTQNVLNSIMNSYNVESHM